MAEFKKWLVINTASQEVRVLATPPALKPTECAFPLIVRVPDTPRRVFSDRPITLTMPGWEPPTVEIRDAEIVETADVRVSELNGEEIRRSGS